MTRVIRGVKETYERVGEAEYNQINPYQRLKADLLATWPDAKILSVKTVWTSIEESADWIFPVLCMRYEVDG